MLAFTGGVQSPTLWQSREVAARVGARHLCVKTTVQSHQARAVQVVTVRLRSARQ